jgi:hypothetical protein
MHRQEYPRAMHERRGEWIRLKPQISTIPWVHIDNVEAGDRSGRHTN